MWPYQVREVSGSRKRNHRRKYCDNSNTDTHGMDNHMPRCLVREFFGWINVKSVGGNQYGCNLRCKWDHVRNLDRNRISMNECEDGNEDDFNTFEGCRTYQPRFLPNRPREDTDNRSDLDHRLRMPMLQLKDSNSPESWQFPRRKL